MHGDDLPDFDLALDDLAAARIGAFADAVRTTLPQVEWFSFPRPNIQTGAPEESPRLYLQDLLVMLGWRDEMKKVNAEAMALLSAIETGLVDKVLALEVFQSDDGTGWIKAAELHAVMTAVADKEGPK